MSGYKLSQIEINKVLSTDADTRLTYLVKRVADWEVIWTLKDKTGFVLLGDKAGVQYVPVWPFAEYAQLSCTGTWTDAHPEAISLDRFMNKWIAGMIVDKRMVAIFPTPTDSPLVMSPEKFKLLLDEALTDYE